MARRDRGEGSIHHRKDGRWVGIADLGWRDGRRARKYVYGTTRAEVRERLTAIMGQLRQGIAPPDDRLTVGQFVERWLADAQPSLRPRTHRRYADLLRLHVLPTLGPVRLAQLGPTRVQELLSRKLGEGLSPQTVAHLRAVLRTALRRAERWGRVARNVAALAEPPRVTRREVVPLDAEAARAIVDAVASDRRSALYVTALGTGLRQGEVLGL